MDPTVNLIFTFNKKMTFQLVILNRGRFIYQVARVVMTVLWPYAGTVDSTL